MRHTAEQRHSIVILKDRKGVSLIIALLILLVLTLLGINAISTSTFETGIAGNVRIYNRAFYASDAGVDYFYSLGDLYVNLTDSTGVLDSRNQGLDLKGDYFLVNWRRKVMEAGPPTKFEFVITSVGISPNLPSAGKVIIEAIIEIVDSGHSGTGMAVKKIKSWREIF